MTREELEAIRTHDLLTHSFDCCPNCRHEFNVVRKERRALLALVDELLDAAGRVAEVTADLEQDSVGQNWPELMAAIKGLRAALLAATEPKP